MWRDGRRPKQCTRTCVGFLLHWQLYVWYCSLLPLRLSPVLLESVISESWKWFREDKWWTCRTADVGTLIRGLRLSPYLATATGSSFHSTALVLTPAPTPLDLSWHLLGLHSSWQLLGLESSWNLLELHSSWHLRGPDWTCPGWGRFNWEKPLQSWCVDVSKFWAELLFAISSKQMIMKDYWVLTMSFFIIQLVNCVAQNKWAE